MVRVLGARQIFPGGEKKGGGGGETIFGVPNLNF